MPDNLIQSGIYLSFQFSPIPPLVFSLLLLAQVELLDVPRFLTPASLTVFLGQLVQLISLAILFQNPIRFVVNQFSEVLTVSISLVVRKYLSQTGVNRYHLAGLRPRNFHLGAVMNFHALVVMVQDHSNVPGDNRVAGQGYLDPLSGRQPRYGDYLPSATIEFDIVHICVQRK